MRPRDLGTNLLRFSHLDLSRVVSCAERAEMKCMVLRPKDDRDLPAKKKTFETNILNFFLERASISNFYGATNQNNSGNFV